MAQPRDYALAGIAGGIARGVNNALMIHRQREWQKEDREQQLAEQEMANRANIELKLVELASSDPGNLEKYKNVQIGLPSIFKRTAGKFESPSLGIDPNTTVKAIKDWVAQENAKIGDVKLQYTVNSPGDILRLSGKLVGDKITTEEWQNLDKIFRTADLAKKFGVKGSITNAEARATAMLLPGMKKEIADSLFAGEPDDLISVDELTAKLGQGAVGHKEEAKLRARMRVPIAGLGATNLELFFAGKDPAKMTAGEQRQYAGALIGLDLQRGAKQEATQVADANKFFGTLPPFIQEFIKSSTLDARLAVKTKGLMDGMLTQAKNTAQTENHDVSSLAFDIDPSGGTGILYSVVVSPDGKVTKDTDGTTQQISIVDTPTKQTRGIKTPPKGAAVGPPVKQKTVVRVPGKGVRVDTSGLNSITAVKTPPTATLTKIDSILKIINDIAPLSPDEQNNMLVVFKKFEANPTEAERDRITGILTNPEVLPTPIQRQQVRKQINDLWKLYNNKKATMGEE
ncbi:MAG: hypothetical protein WC449_05455 [Candidatus Paceibacterota bacterium]